MHNKIKSMVLVSLFAVLISILSIFKFPMPSGVPVTLQPFSVAICGYILGAKKGVLSILIYILLGLIGIPVFSGMSSGFSHLIGLSGGFIFGFILLVFFCGFSCKFKNKYISFFISMVGLALCNVIGVIQYSLLSKNSLFLSFISVSLPYLLKDAISILVAMIISNNIKQILHKNNIKI